MTQLMENMVLWEIQGKARFRVSSTLIPHPKEISWKRREKIEKVQAN